MEGIKKREKLRVSGRGGGSNVLRLDGFVSRGGGPGGMKVQAVKYREREKSYKVSVCIEGGRGGGEVDKVWRFCTLRGLSCWGFGLSRSLREVEGEGGLIMRRLRDCTFEKRKC